VWRRLWSSAGRTYSGRPVRRFLVALAACAAPAAFLAVAACVSGGKVTVNLQPDADSAVGAGEGGGDASEADAVEELSVADQCGPEPWVNLGIVVVALSLGNLDGSPLPGAQFTSPLCPSLVKYSDEGGNILGQVSKDTPFYGRLQAQNYISELAPEEIFDADSTGHKIDMIPTLIASVLLPTFDASSETAIVVAGQKVVDDAGPCSTLDGVTYSVPGHPEAVITYFSADTIPQPIPDGGATTTEGIAAITGLATGQLVTLQGTKPGCSVLLKYQTQTGRVPVQTGFVSLMPAYVSP
jgi:hypothetical protein